MTEAEKQEKIDQINSKKSWTKALKEAVIEVIECTANLESEIEIDKAIPLSSMDKPKSLMEVGRCYKRLGEAYTVFAQQLTFSLLRKPKHESKKETGSQEEGQQGSGAAPQSD